MSPRPVSQQSMARRNSRSYIDMAAEMTQVGRAQDVAAAVYANANQKSRRILVVDDNENNLLVLSNMLEPNGFVVEQARSGEECLELLGTRVGTADVPDLVLLDVMMGGISGVECCAEIRRNRGMAEYELPVILVTATEYESTVTKGTAAHHQCFQLNSKLFVAGCPRTH